MEICPRAGGPSSLAAFLFEFGFEAIHVASVCRTKRAGGQQNNSSHTWLGLETTQEREAVAAERSGICRATWTANGRTNGRRSQLAGAPLQASELLLIQVLLLFQSAACER